MCTQADDQTLSDIVGMILLIKRSNQEKVIFEIFHTIKVRFKIFVAFPQRNQTRVIHLVGVVLSFKKVEE